MNVAELMKKRKGVAIGIAVSVAWCCLVLLLIWKVSAVRDLCQRINLKIYDWKVAFSSAPPTHGDIVHVDIDDKAIEKLEKQLGQWPWDRSVSAKIVRRLSELGAKVIVFDILYTQPKRTEEDKKHNQEYGKGDLEFFRAIKKAGNVVTATALGESDNPSPGDWVQSLTENERPRADALYDEKTWNLEVPPEFKLKEVNKWRNTQVPMVPIIKACAEVGHIKAARDHDGVHRRLPLLERYYLDHYLPSLSLAALKVFWGFSEKDITLTRQYTIEIRRGGETVTIPVDEQGVMLVNWGDVWQSFKSYTVLDILSDKEDPSRRERYQDKIVIVGVTWTGLSDIGVSPRSGATPLSRIHSHGLSTIFTRSFIRTVSPWYMIFLAIALAIPCSLAAARIRVRLGVGVALVISLVFFASVIASFNLWWIDIPMVEFFLIFIPAPIASLVGRAVSIELQASKTAKALERYLSRELLEKILYSGTELDLSTKRRELTVLFVDIRGFSTISESVDVDYIAQFLNDFFQRMTRAVFDNRGTIDKFLGDGLLAFFGDPIPIEHHGQAAVKTALQMQSEMIELNKRWKTAGIAEFEKGISIRIGINTGLMVVGDLGSARRLEYTVIGSAVNVASRLQNIASPGGIMMTARTRALMQEAVECEGPQMVKVRGIDREIEVYQIQPEAVAAWQEASGS